MDDIKVFYDNKGQPEYIQMPHGEYEKMVEYAKECIELKEMLGKVNDLIRVFV
jgi:hypothetical protein